MKKSFLCLMLGILFNLVSFGQTTDLELNILNAEYEVETSSLTFDLQFTNKTNDTLVIIKPFNHFFNRHYQPRANKYTPLKSDPYKIHLDINRKCKDGEVMRIVPPLGKRKTLSNTEIFQLSPKTSKSFKAIKLELFDTEFCKRRKYTFAITYTPEIVKNNIHPTTEIDSLITQLNALQAKIKLISPKYDLNDISLKSQIQKLLNKRDEINQISKINTLNTTSEKLKLSQQ